MFKSIVRELGFALQSSDAEVEARYGYMDRGQFYPGVYRDEFLRFVHGYVLLRQPQDPVESIDEIQGNVRKTTIGRDATWMRKERIKNLDDTEYGVRVSVSTERAIPPPDSFAPTTQRKKTRYTFDMQVLRLDMTIVTTGKDVTYEVELERTSAVSVETFTTHAQLIYRLIHGTHILYSLADQSETIGYLNYVLGQQGRFRVSSRVLNKPRNLRIEDMVYGGLVGNSRTTYRVSHKTDGVRKMLFVASTGVWLISPPYHTDLLLSRTYNSPLDRYLGAVLDGEWIQSDNRYFVFDCIAYPGEPDIQQRTHTERLLRAQEVKDMLPLQQIYMKDFIELRTPESFFLSMRDMFERQAVLPYKQDGFIFTPNRAPYHPDGEYQRLSDRVLTRYADTCKWKPREDITIDFYVILREGRVVLQTGDHEDFTGTARYPLNAVSDKILATDAVVEYQWSERSDGVEGGILEPRLVRPDKEYPNNTEVALDNWYQIHNPILTETLKGESLQLTFRWHNRIKRELYNRAPGHTLLDIGSGQGGDVGKWLRFTKIVAVEPNKNYLPELQRRIEGAGLTDRVRILNTGGEDTKTIARAVEEHMGKADIISSMLSMSFFWKSREMVDALCNTINACIHPKGQFIFLTIDGDTVAQVFEPAFKGFTSKKIQLLPAIFDYNSTKRPIELKITVPGSFFGSQVEYPPRLDDLRIRLRPWVLSEVSKAEGEKFLTLQETIYTRMYTYGRFTVSGKALPVSEPTVILEPMVGQPSNPHDRARGDDVIYPLVPRGPDGTADSNKVRIAVIGEGNGFFHALLKATNRAYQNNPSYKFRTDMVERLRESFANRLEEPVDQEKTWYDTTDFPSLFAQGKEEYRMDRVQQTIRQGNITKEIYSYVAGLWGVNLVIGDWYEYQGGFEYTVILWGNEGYLSVVAEEVVDAEGAVLYKTLH